MLSTFKSNTSAITKFLEKNSIPDDTLSVIMSGNIEYLMKILIDEELSKIVLCHPCQKFRTIGSALKKYEHGWQILIYVDCISLYLLFDTQISLEDLVKKLNLLKTKPSLYQIMKKEFTQKLTVTVIDEGFMKMVRGLFGDGVSIEQTCGFMWEITINDKLYPNYDDVEAEYNRIIQSKNCVGKVFLNPLLSKDGFKYSRCNITSIFKDLNTLKHMICEIMPDQLMITGKTTAKKTSITMKNTAISEWIFSNPPQDNEQKLDYYDRFEKQMGDKAISKNIFTKYMKASGYQETKLKGRIYWKLESP